MGLPVDAKAHQPGSPLGTVPLRVASTFVDTVAEKLGEAVGKDIDRRRITLEAPIKELGTHTLTLRLGSDIAADFDVVVESLEPIEESDSVAEPAEESEPAVEE